MIDVIEVMKSKHLYDNCQLEKLSWLHFSSSKHSNTTILEKNLCDLWGSTPILSFEKISYNASLVDDLSK